MQPKNVAHAFVSHKLLPPRDWSTLTSFAFTEVRQCGAVKLLSRPVAQKLHKLSFSTQTWTTLILFLVLLDGFLCLSNDLYFSLVLDLQNDDLVLAGANEGDAKLERTIDSKLKTTATLAIFSIRALCWALFERRGGHSLLKSVCSSRHSNTLANLRICLRLSPKPRLFTKPFNNPVALQKIKGHCVCQQSVQY